MKSIQMPALAFLACACAEPQTTDVQQLLSQNLQSAETFIDAFYTFDRAELEPLLSRAQGSAAAILYYQGWAEGGNYRIVERQACKAESATTISCAVTEGYRRFAATDAYETAITKD